MDARSQGQGLRCTRARAHQNAFVGSRLADQVDHVRGQLAAHRNPCERRAGLRESLGRKNRTDRSAFQNVFGSAAFQHALRQSDLFVPLRRRHR